MNDDPMRSDTERVQLLLDQSERALSDLIKAFDLMSDRIECGDDIPLDELHKTYSAMSQARARLISEVKEHDKRVLRAEGCDPEAPLDFGAIRAEIGRRLDRIRATLDEESLSGEP